MTHKRLKILVVDDTSLVVNRLFSLLGEMDADAELLKAASYDEAIAIIAGSAPDIILLDIQMPGKNGIELLADTRKKYPGIIIIMLTNMVSDFYKDLCKEMGANHFVDKSKEFEKIPVIIQSYLPVKGFNNHESSP